MAPALRDAGRRLASVVAAVLVAWVCTSGPVTPDVSHRPALTLGLAGPYDDSSLTAARSAGVTDLLVEMTWREAEPAAGRFDESYLAHIARQVADLRAAGFRITLNTGLQDAPAWVLDLPGGRFVDQDGDVFRRTSTPNLVFGAVPRQFAQPYLARVFAVVGTRVHLVRAGGGVSGELSYPYTFDRAGLVQNRYWAFDEDAQRTDPVPGWKPGDASPHGEAGQFLTWYLDALVDYQDWQVAALREAGYHGTIAMLYPSHGMRPGDFDAAVATNLVGTSSAEVNGEVQRGYDFARQIPALTDPDVAVYGTWGENLATVDYLAELAHSAGRPVMAENAGPVLPGELADALRNAVVHRLTAFYLIRASDLADATAGHADFADVARTYRGLTG